MQKEKFEAIPPEGDGSSSKKSYFSEFWSKASKNKKIIIIIFVVIAVLLISIGITIGLILGLIPKSEEQITGLFYTDNNDLQIFSVLGVEVYGIKDYFGNIRSIYAVRALNTTILIQNEKIGLTHFNNESIIFLYDEIKYQAIYLKGNYSKDLKMYPNFNFSFYKYNYSESIMDIPYEDPFKGVVITIQDSINVTKIPLAVVDINFNDLGLNRSVILPIIGRGKYFLPILRNSTTKRMLSNVTDSVLLQRANNFRSSLGEQIKLVKILFQKYPFTDICSVVPYQSILCSNLNRMMNEVLQTSFSYVQKHISTIPTQEQTYHILSDFFASVSVPGSYEQYIKLAKSFDSESLYNRSYKVDSDWGYCDDVTVAGTDYPDTRIINVGRSNGTIKFSYETYSLKDKIDVYYSNNLLFSTGCFGGRNSKNLSFNGNETIITVKVTPNCENTTGTLWNYVIQCQESYLICKDNYCGCFPNGVPTQTKKPINDGCGSLKIQQEWAYQFIYSTGKLWGFEESCNSHDICYGTCGSNRQNCDETFYNEMKLNCKEFSGIRLENCLKFADIYYYGITMRGEEDFIISQREYCACS